MVVLLRILCNWIVMRFSYTRFIHKHTSDKINLSRVYSLMSGIWHSNKQIYSRFYVLDTLKYNNKEVRVK